MIQDTYKILNYITLNATGDKYNAIAMPAIKAEIKQHKQHFLFDFTKAFPENIVYKIFIESEPDVIQEFVAFRKSQGFLQCESMETHNMNKHGKPFYNGVGKLMVALCCKVSDDLGMGGFISFTAKNILFTYYARLGAKRLGTSNTMFIDEIPAQKLIEKYF